MHASSSIEFAPHVLLIDDQAIVAEMLAATLEGQGDVSMVHLADATQAVEAVLRERPSVVLIDLMMPAIDGFAVIRMLRSHPETRHLPLVLLSAEDEAEPKVRGFAEGADDYLVKWPHRLELVARIRYHSNAYHTMRQRDAAFVSLQKSQQDLLQRTQQLAESQAALQHAQRMEAIGKLTGGVAHDFNNVLQIISSNLQLIKLELSEPEKVLKRIASAGEGIKRGSLLASQLLAFGRRQTLQPGVIDTGRLLAGVHELLQRSLGEAVQVETMVKDDIWTTLADPNQLENVILNLAINARDAMQAQGTVKIDAFNFSLDPADAAEHRGLKAGDYVVVQVSDNGAGMPPEVLERAFEPFFTTKPPGQGTGLGLSMAYGFAKQSGGHIELTSTEGMGTEVTLYLPRAAGAAAELAPLALPKAAERDTQETVLVVEDEPVVRATTVDMLQRLGYCTLHAEHAEEALQLLKSGIRVDLLFTDVVMPGPLRSDELAAKAKLLLPDIKILFASGYVDRAMLGTGSLDPNVTLLRKPYNLDDLAQHLHLALRHSASAAGR